MIGHVRVAHHAREQENMFAWEKGNYYYFYYSWDLTEGRIDHFLSFKVKDKLPTIV